MKDKILELLLSKKANIGFSVIMGGIIGGLLYKLGENTGTYHGTVDTNERWRDAVDRIVKEEKTKSQMDSED